LDKKVRVSKQNFFDFKKTANAAEIKNFEAALQNGDDFFLRKNGQFIMKI
jgi:hypothetical protein